METNNRNYLIINVLELDKIDFEQICETSADTLRYSVDKSKTFIKWENDSEPDFLIQLNTKEGPYDINEILEIMSTDFWTKSENIIN
jgi:hypothetical protein